MNITPRFDFIIAREPERSDTTDSGLYIPDTAESEEQEAIIVSCGPEVADDLQPGARVLYHKYEYSEIEVDDEELLILRDPNIKAILED